MTYTAFMMVLTFCPVEASGAESTERYTSQLNDQGPSFLENRGQVDEGVAYYATGFDKTVFFTTEGVTFLLEECEGIPSTSAVNLEFVGADGPCQPRAEGLLEGWFSFFIGSPENWKTDVPTFSKVIYDDLWPGIDMIWSGARGELKYEFAVHPGADPDKIRLTFRGATGGEIKPDGSLLLSTPAGNIEDAAPVAYQELDGASRDVEASFALEGPDENNLCTVTFNLGEYDRAETLVLDPSMLFYCGFICGDAGDMCYGVATDTAGNAYLIGRTSSTHTTFPVAVGPDITHNGMGDAFIAKIDPTGSSLIYCGYIGGADEEDCYGVAVDQAGCAYVTGATWSNESTFPVTVGPDLTFNGAFDAFVARVKSDGTALDYCGFVGGANMDVGTGIALLPDGGVILAGYTLSNVQQGFPVIVGPGLTSGGRQDAFAASIPPLHKLIRAGNVNASPQWPFEPQDVLFVNGIAGGDANRRVIVASGGSPQVDVATPLASPNRAAFVLYAWPGEAGSGDWVDLPSDLGKFCFSIPLSSGSPNPPPWTLINNLGYPLYLGRPLLQQIPKAPVSIGPVNLNPGIYTIQGIIEDSTALSDYSLTNAVVIEIQ